jgi:hypothetical protein
VKRHEAVTWLEKLNRIFEQLRSENLDDPESILTELIEHNQNFSDAVSKGVHALKETSHGEENG